MQINNNSIKFTKNCINFIFLFSMLFIGFLMWFLSVIGIFSNFTNYNIIACVVYSLVIGLVGGWYYKSLDLGIDTITSIIGLGAVALTGIVYVCFIPPFTYDEIAYSVSLPRDYSNANHYYYNADYGPYSAFPQNYEMLTTLGIILFKNAYLPKLINLYMALGLGLAAGVISLYCGNSRKVSIISGLLVMSSPALLSATPIAKNDIANAFFQAWAIVFLLVYRSDYSFKKALAFAFCIGTSFGIKYNSLLTLFIPGVLFLFITLTASLSLKQKVCRCVLVLAVTTITALPWYLNNYFLFKNPLFPAMSAIFKSYNLFNEEYVKMLHEVLYLDVENFSWTIGASHAFIIKCCKGFGYVAFIGGFIGALISFYTKENKNSKFIAITLMLMFIVIMRFGLWDPRYSLVLLPLLGALSTLPINHILNLFASSRFKLNKNMLIHLVLIILVCLSVYHGSKIFGRIQKLYAFNSENVFFETSVPGWKVANYLNKNTPTDAKIAVGIGNNQIFYYLNRPYYHLHPLTEKGNLLGVENGNDLIKLLKSENIRYIALSDYYRFRVYNARAPHLYGFLSRINASIDDLLKRQILNQITSIDSDVKIFEVVY